MHLFHVLFKENKGQEFLSYYLCKKLLPLNRRPLVIWTQFLHTMSDFYAIYMVGKLGPRATTSVLKIFPKSDPKQP